MRKFSLVLAVLVVLAGPAWATVTVDCDTEEDTVTVGYVTTGEMPVRGFALDITVTGATITSASVDNSDYWVYPGSIVIIDGEVNQPGSGVCDSGEYDGTCDGIGSNCMTIEMGSLYVGDGNKPDTSGTLCTFTVSETCEYSVEITENTIRAGVVMEDPCTPSGLILSGCEGPPCDVELPCGPGCTYTGDNEPNWVDVNMPCCWATCYDPLNVDVDCGRQCLGDATCSPQGKNLYWVSTQDLTLLLLAWGKPYPDLIDGGGNHLVVDVGVVPERLVKLICGDFDHKPQGKNKYRVSTDDITILLNNWQIPDGPAPTCP
jgi:hypothetical protein